MSGGDEEDRTPDPLLARQVLSQLSYTPKFYPSPDKLGFFSLVFFIQALLFAIAYKFHAGCAFFAIACKFVQIMCLSVRRVHVVRKETITLKMRKFWWA